MPPSIFADPKGTTFEHERLHQLVRKMARDGRAELARHLERRF
jgi:hypothetical protein